MLYNSIITEQSQAQLDKYIAKLQDRMRIKETLIPYITKIYKNQYDDNFLIRTRNQNLIEAFTQCGKELFWNGDRIIGAAFCRQRICPVCNLRRSNITYHKIAQIVEAIPDKDYVLITLTVKNCAPAWLSKTIDNLLQSFHRLVNRKSWHNAFDGYFRTLEITYNAKDDSFHPHLHILAKCSADYFDSCYIDNADLRRMWTESANLPYYVQTDIRKIEDNTKGIAEVAKYAVKMSSIISNKVDSQRLRATQILLSTLKNRRLIATGGIISKTAKQLKIDFEDQESTAEITAKTVLYTYQNGKYIKSNL